MKRTDLSSIGRALDLTYPTNRAIAVVTLLVTVGGLVWQSSAGVPWFASATWGVQAGLTVFLAWAVCRELDPDHPVAAFPAAGLALVAVLSWGLPKLTAVLWLVILVRVVNHSTGLPAGLLDALGLVGLAGWLSVEASWSYGFITALGFILDSQLPEPSRRQLLFGLLSFIVTGLVAVLGLAPLWQGLSVRAGLVVVGLSLLFLPVILSASSLDSVGDEAGEPLTPARVQAAQVLALSAGVVAALLDGPGALVTLAPLWASVLGASLTWLFNTVTSLGLSS